VVDFWRRMEECFRPVLGEEAPDRSTRPDSARLPRIELDPPPDHWPDPEQYLHEDPP
jgi:hypothetical protein